MALQISRGIVPSAQKVVIYGVEGIGKSTFASCFPNPLFIDTEGSTKHMDVARLEAPKSWNELLQQISAVKAEKPCQTLVIDTIDWAERLAAAHIVAEANNLKVKSIEDFGYGAGYVKLVEEFSRMLDRLSDVADAGINVVLVAHADIRKFEQPEEVSSYDRWELKLSKSGQKKVAPVVKEWADAVLFLNYETIVEAVGTGMGASKGKARGGTKRAMFCAHNACWDAKNRWGLSDKVPMEYEQIAAHIPAGITDTAPTGDVRTRHDDAFAKAAAADAQLKEIRAKQNGKTADAVIVDEMPAKPEAAARLPDFWGPALRLMESAGITPEEIKRVSIFMGNFTKDTPLENYPEDYITGFIVPKFEAVKARVKEMQEMESIPF